jgi:hypothetical protein
MLAASFRFLAALSILRWVLRSQMVGRNAVPRTPAFDFPMILPWSKDEPLRCVEILGGNILRTEGLFLGGLEVLLVARSAGDGGRAKGRRTGSGCRSLSRQSP